MMDETLGTASFEISKLTVGQTETVPVLIGKVSCLCSRNTVVEQPK